jgi:tetratricopeptide (TPR) repeat protein
LSRSQNKINNSWICFALAVFSVGALCPELVTAKNKATSASKKKSGGAKKTVGELLSSVTKQDRGAGIQSKKPFTSLPESRLQFNKISNYNLDDVKPPRSSEILIANSAQGDLANYEKILDRQIDELYKLTIKFKSSSTRGELWLRLAELYVEKAVLIDSREQTEFDRKLLAFNQGKTKQKPVLESSSSRAYNKKAVQLYEWFQRDFPSDPKMAQALYFLGYNYFELGEPQKGADFYERLQASYPKSQFVGESRFALGEYYFENDKWSKAYNEYSSLIKDKRHPLHFFAAYKGAWCLYRIGRYQEALKYIEYIIKSGREGAESSESRRTVNKSKLENEAQRDIIVFYAAAGDPRKAPEYFRNMLGKDEWAHVEKLAYYSMDKGNKDASLDLFKLLIERDPLSPKAFEFQYQIVQSFFYAKNSSVFKEELYRWIKDYGAASQWYGANQSNQELLTNSYKLREQTFRNWILQQHQTAQNSRTKNSQKMANDGYKLYLQEFPTSPFVSEMHFYHGELLYDMGQFDEAGVQYKWVVDNAPQSKFADKSAQNLLLAVEKSVPTDKELQSRIGQSTDPIPLDPKAERFITAAQWYIEKFPNSEKVPEIRFRIGRLYYQHNQFDQANKIFKEVVQRYPKTKYSEYSANLILDIYNLKKDYIGLERTGQELLAAPSFAGTKAGEEIRNVLEKANFKKAQDLEGDKNYAQSAFQYENFATQNPKSNLSITAWFNAGVNFERAGLNEKAVKSYQNVLASKDPTAAPTKQKTKRLLAKLYQDAMLYDEAAKLFAEAAEEAPQDPLAVNYIYNAAVMYESLGKNREAIKLYEEFLQKSKKQQDKLDVIFSLAEMHRKSNQRTAALNRYKEYVESNPTNLQNIIEAHYQLSQLSRGDEASQWKEKTIAVQRRLAQRQAGVGAQFAAQLKLEKAQETFRQLKALTIPNDPQKQKKAVNQKLETLSQLTKELGDVIKVDSAEEIVASLNLIGEANAHMAQSILSAPIPKGLNPEEEKQYKEGISKVAEPFNVKSKEGYKLAVDRSRELDVFNQAYKNSFEVMSKADPVMYYNHGEAVFDTRYVNWIGL